MDLKNAIIELSNINAPSGCEDSAVRLAGQMLEPYVDEMWTDPLGSLIGIKRCGKPGAKKLMLDAHLDEVGLVVTGYEDGFLRFSTIRNGIDYRTLLAREVIILTERPVYGVITSTPPHLQSKNDADKSVDIEDLLIDIGMTQERALSAVPIGTPAVIKFTAFALGNGRICGKAMDDRCCFAAILMTMEMLASESLDLDIFVVGSSMEEAGCIGAKTAAFSIAPDYAVALDATFAETPDTGDGQVFKMGGGPVIGIGPNLHRKYSDRLIELAKDNDIEYQLEVMPGNTGTNAWPIQISREGVPTALLSVPVKYMHSPVETVLVSDVEKTANLLKHFILNLSKEGV